ncbi:hypothetical protein [Actinomycetospora soli]|uniref:hypothetical protein n=1 Tax=Actinomycetospora soli TaxID=2893887 RepID=UPI001E56E047|nr:hypothetical protein [Actinomycetospora soli]MCD2191634.1 hypothetical protein [Actinomycetospora soli]
MTDKDRADQLEMARQRLHVLEAAVSAVDRRDEVSAVISAAADSAAATEALAALLGTDNAGARAVLGLHWSAFTRARAQYAREDLEEVRRAIAELEQP